MSFSSNLSNLKLAILRKVQAKPKRRDKLTGVIGGLRNKTVKFKTKSTSQKKSSKNKRKYNTLNMTRQKMNDLILKSTFDRNTVGSQISNPEFLKFIYSQKFREKAKKAPNLVFELGSKKKSRLRVV